MNIKNDKSRLENIFRDRSKVHHDQSNCADHQITNDIKKSFDVSQHLETDFQFMGGIVDSEINSAQNNTMMDDPNMMEALNIFMLLNDNNDGYIQYEETKDLRKVILALKNKEDKGVIDSDEKFKEIFYSLNLYNIDIQNFKYILDKMQINIKKVSEDLYEQEYHGCFNIFCCKCLKCCCKGIRHKMVQGKLKEIDNEQKVKKRKYTDMFTIIKQFQASIVEGFDLFTDIILLNQIYWEGMKPENQDKSSYKIAVLVIFISICSCFLIAYSSIVNMLLYNGVYEPAQIRRQGYCMVLFRLLFLSFIGPFYFIFIEALNKIMNLVAFFGLLCGKDGHVSIKNFFLEIIKRVFGLHQEQAEGLETQRGIVQLCFESIPMIILQILIREKILDLGDLFEGEGSSILFLSLLTTLLSVAFVLFNVRIESKAFDEDILEYTLNCFKARQQWIPFIHQIRQQELKQAVNYSELYCEYPNLTGKSGAYKLFIFRFTDISLQKLTSELVKWDNRASQTLKNELEYLVSDDEEMEGGDQDNQLAFQMISRDRYIMDFGGSVEFCTLNMLLHFYNLAPKNKINIKLTGIKWKILLQNAISMNLIKRSKKKGNKYQAMTLSGQHLLWVCVDDEKLSSYVLESVKIYRKFVKLTYNYAVMQAFLFQSRKEIEDLSQDDENKQKQEKFESLLEICKIQIGNYDILKAVRDDIKLMIQLRSQDNADMEFISSLMIKVSKRIKELSQDFKNSQRQIANFDSHANDFFSKVQNLKMTDLEKTKFIDFIKNIEYVPEIEFIEEIESLEVPEFFNPNSWVLEDCFKMLVQTDTNINLKNFDGCDMDILDNFDETLLNHAIKTFKNRSLNLMLRKGANLELANSKGITPVGQAIISKNAIALDFLLKHGADIHKNCIEDLTISNKLMKPLHYFAKLIRLFGSSREVQSILEVIEKHKIEISDQDERIGVQRQFCRLVSSRYFNDDSVKKAMSYFKIAGENNLLEMKDKKENNFSHLSLKGQGKKSYFNRNDLVRLINTYGHDAEGQNFDYSHEDIKEQLSKQISEDNKAGKSALGEAFSNMARHTVQNLVQSFVEKFDKKQEKQAIDYIYAASGTSFGFFTSERFSDYYIPIRDYFEDWEEVKKTVVKMARADAFASEYTWPNLVGADFVPNEKTNSQNQLNYGRQNRRESQPRDLVVKPTYYDDKPIGKYMRVQPSTDVSQLAMIKEEANEEDIDEAFRSVGKKEGSAKDAQQQGDDNENITLSKKIQLRTSSKLSVKIQDEIVEIKKDKQANKYFELVFNIFLEFIALFDMIGDIYALIVVYNLGHIAWFSISVFTMISPFYVCYVPLLTFQKERAEQIQNDSYSQKILAFMSLTPLILINLLFMDFIYIFNSVIVTPIAFIVTCGRLNMEMMEEKVDSIYNYLFGMTDMDIKGFRRLRTISQLTFESFPQIILQIRILFYTLDKNDDEIGVDMEAILISLTCAVIHAIFELIFLHLEAVSCKTTKIHYTIVCFNARFGWIPFIHYFSSVSGFDDDDENAKTSADKMDMDLNYEGMKSNLCQIVFQMKFKFSDATCRVLTNSLSNLLIERIAEKRYKLKIGESLNEVSFDSIFDLVQMAYMRVNLDISEVNIKSIINNSIRLLEELKNPDKDVKTKDNFMVIQQTVSLSQGSILEELLNVEGIDIDIKPSLFEIAENNLDYEMMKLLINHPVHIKYVDYIGQLCQVKQSKCQFKEWIKHKNVQFICALLTSPRVIVTEQYQYYLMKRVLDELNKNNVQNASYLMSFVFGRVLPYHLIKGDGRDQSMRDDDALNVQTLIHKFHNFFNSHKLKLKDVVHFYKCHTSQGHQNMVLPTEVVSCFAVLRQMIISHWPLDHLEFNDKMIGGKYNPFDLCHTLGVQEEPFRTVCLLISDEHSQVQSLTPRQILECDEVVSKLRLDKFRARYFARSRCNDQTYHYYDLLVTELPQLSLDVRNEYREDGFGQRVVLPDDRSQFHGMTCRVFDYTLPEDVLAIKSFEIYYEFFGGAINMTILSSIHQSFAGISLHDDNRWYAETYKEEFQDDDPQKRAQSQGGYQEILANVKAGDTIQLWIETNGYAFAKNVKAKISVYKQLAMAHVEKLESN